MFDIIVKNGQTVLPYSIARIDIGIENGKIAALGDLKEVKASRTIEASGKLILPGLIDPHLHIKDVYSALDIHAPDDFYTATIAAAFGGVTTVIDFAFPVPGRTMQEAIQIRQADAEGQTVLDYSLHTVIDEMDEIILDAMENLPELGIRSVKLFLQRGGMANNDAILRVLKRAKELDLLVMTHAETRDLLEGPTQRLVAAGQVSPRYYPQSRPAVSESEATVRAIHLSEVAGNSLYVVHISVEKALEAVRRAQMRGQPVWGETTSHYLSLTDEVYNRADGAKYICAPPIRKQADQDALWQGLNDGVIHTVCSDHCGFNVAQRLENEADFRRVPPGLAGIETHPSVIFSEGVMKKRISLERFVEITSTNPARIFGLYPKKGVIAPGSDADLCLIDPDITWTITPETLHFDWGWNPNSDLEIKGKPIIVMANGKIIIENNEFKGEQGSGKFLAQNKSQITHPFPPFS